MKLDASDIADLVPVIAEVVRQTMAAVAADEAKFSGRLAFTESEAAGLLGMARHVLRDCRLRGEISGQLIGKRVFYSRVELLRFLQVPLTGRLPRGGRLFRSKEFSSSKDKGSIKWQKQQQRDAMAEVDQERQDVATCRTRISAVQSFLRTGNREALQSQLEES